MSKHNSDGSQYPPLIMTAIPKDGLLTQRILAQSGIQSIVCSQRGNGMQELEPYGALLISAELLVGEYLENLRGVLQGQPAWSQIPVLVVSAGSELGTQAAENLDKFVRVLRNVTVLEKPVRIATLVTIIRSALQSRKKQFDLRDILEQLEESKKAAEQASVAKSAFLANMSHEIRTPLAAIIGFTGLLKNSGLSTEERQQSVAIVARNADQLYSLINDILDLSKIEAGKIEIEDVSVSLPSFIAEITSLVRPLIEVRGLKFQAAVAADLPALVMIDPNRVRQILMNLISNAAKFTTEGSVQLKFWIEGASPQKLLFSVTDTGIGISEENVKKLFSPFTQADSSTTRKYGGTGLGLSLSRELARAMGGDLILKQTEFGRGSTFEASLGLKISRVELATVRPHAEQRRRLDGLKVLLAEDSPDNQLLMKRYLTAAGASVEVASDGRAAVNAALSATYDVILMDVQMPILDGLSATQELRAQGYSVPILALTAHAMLEERRKSVAAGCNEHLSKPIPRDELIDAVARFAAQAKKS